MFLLANKFNKIKDCDTISERDKRSFNGNDHVIETITYNKRQLMKDALQKYLDGAKYNHSRNGGDGTINRILNNIMAVSYLGVIPMEQEMIFTINFKQNTKIIRKMLPKINDKYLC